MHTRTRVLKSLQAKVLTALGCFALLLGAGAAVTTVAAQQENEVVETKAAVINGKYRINVLTNSSNWLQDSVNTVFNPAGSNVVMTKDGDFAQSTTNSSYATVTIGATTYNWQTYVMSAKTGITKNENYWFGRGTADNNYNWFDSGINLYNTFRSNYYDNTIIIKGTWDNFSAEAYGWYVKVCLHTGLDLATTSYSFMNYGSAPSDPAVITGYSFAGWYTDSGLTSKWTSGSQYTDINLYAKYTLSSYSVTLNTNGGTINAGNVTSYTYGTGATLPANVTRVGYTFGGWFANEGLTGSAVTSISTTDTGNKTFWAKWTEIYTDLWVSIDGGTKIKLATKKNGTGNVQYEVYATGIQVWAGQSITFWRGASAGTATTAVTSSNGLTATADTQDDSNNVVTSDGTWTIHNYAAAAEVYFKVMNTSPISFEFWVTGEESHSPTSHGIQSGHNMYIQDLLKKNGNNYNFETDNTKIAVYFSKPAGEAASIHAWSSAFATKDNAQSTDTVTLYTIAAPQFSGRNVTWTEVQVLRYSSDVAIGDVSFLNSWKDNDSTSMKHGVQVVFTDPVQNGVQITAHVNESLGDGYCFRGNAFMYTDGGLQSKQGVYIDIDPAPAGSWILTGEYGIYVYFFSIVGGDGEATAWSAKATKVPGRDDLYETEVPKYNDETVRWAKLIVVNNNTQAFRAGEYQYQTQDLWYDAEMETYQCIAFTGNYVDDKSEAGANASYTDATRSESWGTRFLADTTCNGTIGSVTSSNWTKSHLCRTR